MSGGVIVATSDAVYACARPVDLVVSRGGFEHLSSKLARAARARAELNRHHALRGDVAAAEARVRVAQAEQVEVLTTWLSAHPARESAAAELAAHLGWSGFTAGQLLDLADALPELPDTRALLAAGQITIAKALIIATELVGLHGPDRLAVEAAVLPAAPESSPGRLRHALRRARTLIDPHAAETRRTKARDTWVGVTHTALDDGLGSVEAVLDGADAVAVWQAVDTLARSMACDPAETRPIRLLRAAAYLDLILGNMDRRVLVNLVVTADPDTLLPDRLNPTGPGDHDDTDRVEGQADVGDERDADDDDDAKRDRRSEGHPDVRSGVANDAEIKGEGHAAIDPLGLSRVELAGHGEITAEQAIEVIASAHAAGDQVGYRRHVVAPDTGALLAVEDRLHRADPGRTGRRDESLDRGGRRAQLDARRAARREARRHDTADTSDPGAAADPRPWLSARIQRILQTALRIEEQQLIQDSYRPLAGLERFIKARDRTCRWPGCRVPAARCDVDHTIGWPHGPTAAWNLACLCRHHHKLKQSRFWSVEQHLNGRMTFTTAAGHTYTTDPPGHATGRPRASPRVASGTITDR